MRAACFVVVMIAVASAARAQAPAAKPTPTQAPAASAPAAAPAQTPAAPAAPEAAPSTPPQAQPPATPAPQNQAAAGAAGEGAAQPAPQPPAAQPPAAAPSESPPPPAYPQLGGKPEPEIQKGDWDPWEHLGAATHRHEGFMLRLAIGLGVGSVVGDEHVLRGGDVTLSSGGLNTEIGIGGALTENLVLNADLFQTTLFNPSVSLRGHDLGDANDLDQDLGVGQDVELTGLGIGVTYYVMPVNVYIAGSIGLGKVIFVDGSGDRSGSDFGFATNIMAGKEWWVGADWGIGVAGQLIFVAANDDILGNVRGLGFGVLFSATYN